MKSIIMAGGVGTRLWPYSRRNFPKQFLSLIGKESFIQTTAKRLAGITSAEDVYVVAGDLYRFNITDHLSRLFGKPFQNLILEPMGKNTAPAIALAVKFMLEKVGVSEDEVLFFSPSDHIIHPEKELVDAVKEGLELAKNNIVTFGVAPNKPETGYGYIELSDTLQGNLLKVNRFVEKPEKETAVTYLQAGNYVWNSGMFMFSIGVILNAFEKFVPELSAILKEKNLKEMIDDYENITPESIDYAVMEKSDNIFCRKINIEWNDIGSWDSVYDILPKDENGNAILGNVEYIDTKNSLILSDKNLTTLVGMNNTAVIETQDAILVCDRNQTQRVKELVNKMKRKERKEVTEHVTTYRPWGSYTILEEGDKYKIKKIVVNPMAKLSLQRHKHRSEHWVVIKGIANVELDDKTLTLKENESAYVPIYVKHRLSNPGNIQLEIIEVQNGAYVGEDDIERFEDVYGRA